MLINSVHYVFDPQNADKALELFRDLREATRKEEGVISFEVARSRENPNTFALWEAYRDRAALDTHLGSEHFRRYVIEGIRPIALRRDGEIVFPI